MSQQLKIPKTVMIIMLLLLAGSAEGVSRVAKRLNVIKSYGAYTSLIGNYSALLSIEFNDAAGPVNVDASNIFDPSSSFGFAFGQIRNEHVQVMVGFRYTNLNVEDTILVSPSLALILVGNPSFRQYDLSFDFNYLFSSVDQSMLVPYVGAGLRSGLTALTARGYQSEYDANIALSLNFGADLRIWKAEGGRSLLTVASANSIDYWGSGNRPRQMTFGLGLNYYFRP